ncbi:MAG: heavy metal-binding domain-containing protein [Alphaproteobacteria bacterium]|nr:heavy metal-binding domain-containing protein [Alphaproteobacteria bacterium]MCB9696675.1 heavy metal-binding domain-containing protein [Alphaproteobacteria bacterium]
MFVSGMSGNEIWCLHQKGYRPGELVVGNSVVSLGFVGGLAAGVRGLSGGELKNVTSLISEGRHLAIERMVKEAGQQHAAGVTSVVSELRHFAGYLEFLSQGTALSSDSPPDSPFTTSASGMEMYCHLDAGYVPVRFAMGNVAYALGIGRSFTGNLRTMARGEVREFSNMYNQIRHLALQRLRKEAFDAGANAVVDVVIRLQPFQQAGAVELLMTGTAASHPGLPKPSKPDDVITSELTGEELWNLAAIGMAPVQLVMATSVYSLGVVGGWGSSLRGMVRGEIPELTSMVYDARHNCVELLKKEAASFGAEQVIGNKLSIREIGQGLVEVMAVGTAVKRAEGLAPTTPVLPPQAIIVETGSLERTLPSAPPAVEVGNPRVQAQLNPFGCLVALLALGFAMCSGLFAAVVESM